jgi:alkyl hydroperoxide reductase subunit AhpC
LKVGRPSEKKKAATLSALADKSDTVRVNFDLDREEHIKLKIYAAKAGKRISEVLRELIAGLDN